jgi:hypothetical protein
VKARKLLLTILAVLALAVTALAGRIENDKSAIAVVQATHEFQGYSRWAERDHFRYTVEAYPDADIPESVAKSVPAPAWCVEVRTLVVDDPKTGEGHGTLAQMFFVSAKTGEVFLYDRGADRVHKVQ